MIRWIQEWLLFRRIRRDWRWAPGPIDRTVPTQIRAKSDWLRVGSWASTPNQRWR